MDAFRSRIRANPLSDTLRFVSLLIPAADTHEISEHFVVEEDGVVVDPTMVNLSDSRTSLECSMYYKCMQDSAVRFGIHSYNCEPLRLTPKQFALFPDIVALSNKVKPESFSLATIRKCVAALLHVWNERETDERLAELVILRVHAIRIHLAPKPSRKLK